MHLLAFSGSPTPGSTVARLLRTAAALAPAGVVVSFYEDVLALPLFEPSQAVAGQPLPPAVAALHQALALADAVLFATPEYAYGIPGSLKNALDWLVAAGSLHGKLTGALSASPSAEGGAKALASLQLTLTALGATLVPAAVFSVPDVRAQLEAPAAAFTNRLQAAVRALADAAAGIAGSSQPA